MSNSNQNQKPGNDAKPSSTSQGPTKTLTDAEKAEANKNNEQKKAS